MAIPYDHTGSRPRKTKDGGLQLGNAYIIAYRTDSNAKQYVCLRSPAIQRTSVITVQSTLRVLECRLSQNSLISQIAFTRSKSALAHWVWIYCFVLNDFSPILMTSLVVLLTTMTIHIISIADNQLVSSFLSELMSIRDSRQSSLGWASAPIWLTSWTIYALLSYFIILLFLFSINVCLFYVNVNVNIY